MARMKNFGKVKLLVLDFDGVLTNNRVYVDQNGKEMVSCWRSDGVGLERIKKLGIKTIVISSERNPVVKKRCTKLGIPCVVGRKDKLSALKEIMEKQNLSRAEVCYIGNDIYDLECLKYVGYPVAVKNSAGEVLGVASYVTRREGGAGAVREVCDLIYKHIKKKRVVHDDSRVF